MLNIGKKKRDWIGALGGAIGAALFVLYAYGRFGDPWGPGPDWVPGPLVIVLPVSMVVIGYVGYKLTN